MFFLFQVLKFDLSPLMCVSYLIESFIANNWFGGYSLKFNIAVFLKTLVALSTICLNVATFFYVALFFNTVHLIFMSVFYVV